MHTLACGVVLEISTRNRHIHVNICPVRVPGERDVRTFGIFAGAHLTGRNVESASGGGG